MKKLTAVQTYFNFKLTDDYRNPDFVIHSQITADGYDVFIAKRTDEALMIEEHVFYYDSDLEETLFTLIYEKDINEYLEIYVDDLEHSFIGWAIEELHDEMYKDQDEEE
jgi:hypothetical protein